MVIIVVLIVAIVVLIVTGHGEWALLAGTALLFFYYYHYKHRSTQIGKAAPLKWSVRIIQLYELVVRFYPSVLKV